MSLIVALEIDNIDTLHVMYLHVSLLYIGTRSNILSLFWFFVLHLRHGGITDLKLFMSTFQYHYFLLLLSVIDYRKNAVQSLLNR